MATTTSETTAQVTSPPDPDDRSEMQREAAEIISRIEDAINEIAGFGDQIDDCVNELVALDGFPEEAEWTADNALRGAVSDLVWDLLRFVKELRGEIAAAAKDEDDATK
jgi:hypothetical protein